MDDNYMNTHKDISELTETFSDIVHFNVMSKNEAKELLLGLLILRRMDCLIADNYSKLSRIPKEAINPDLVYSLTGISFYNNSKLTLKEVAEDNNELSSFHEYIGGYCDEVRRLINDLCIERILTELSKVNSYFKKALKLMGSINLSKDIINDTEMDYLLLKVYGTNCNSYEMDIPNDVVSLMISLVLNGGNDINSTTGPIIVGDYSFGIGSTLIDSATHIKKKHTKTEVILTGMEMNTYKYSFARLRMMLLRLDTLDVKNANCIINPEERLRKATYSLMFPPIEESTTIKEYKEIIDDEYKGKKSFNRFKAGLPSMKNGFFLYLMHQISMLSDTGGKAAIISPPSALLSKKNMSNNGVVSIRRWLLEEDIIEAIIKLPNNLFYNTGITLYLWILNKKKYDVEYMGRSRKGIIQFIDGTRFYEEHRLKCGFKLRSINEDNKKEIFDIYNRFQNAEYSRLIDVLEIGPDEDWSLYF